MARGAWKRTSAVMALLANCHRNRNERPEPFVPADFNPFAPRKPREKAGIEISFRQFEIVMTSAMKSGAVMKVV